MAYYGQREQMPNYGFTPDAEFPALNGEKGIVSFEIAKKFAKNPKYGAGLRSLTGGAAANMVAEHARAVVKHDTPESYGQIRELAAAYRKRPVIKSASKVSENLWKSRQTESRPTGLPQKRDSTPFPS